MDTLSTRLASLLKAKNGASQSDLARYVGVTPQAVQKWMAGVAEPRGKNLEMAAQYLGVTPSFLKFGFDPNTAVGIEELHKLHGVPPGTFRRVEVLDDDDPRLTIIPRVRLRLTAGICGFEVEPIPDDDSTTTVPTKWIKDRGFNKENLISIQVRGESMEPTLYADDTVTLNVADKQPFDGGVFAINYEGEPVVKRLIRDAGQWWLSSDNPDQRKYQRKLCQGEGCIIVGRVVRRESERF